MVSAARRIESVLTKSRSPCLTGYGVDRPNASPFCAPPGNGPLVALLGERLAQVEDVLLRRLPLRRIQLHPLAPTAPFTARRSGLGGRLLDGAAFPSTRDLPGMREVVPDATMQPVKVSTDNTVPATNPQSR